MLKDSTVLYKHQVASVFQFHIRSPKTADWSDCGVGKSLLALSKYDALYDAGLARCMLVVCPLSVMSSWRDEIKKHTNFKVTTLTGTKEQRMHKLLDDSHIYLSTYDSIVGRGSGRMLLQFSLLDKFKGNNMIVCDEATMIKSIEAKRTQALIAICDEIKYSMFLSGTFMPQDLQDIFTIYRAMDGGETFGENIYAARGKYMMNIGDTFPKWTLKLEMEKEFLSKLYLKAVRLRKEDCLELPPKIHEVRKCYLHPVQATHYALMRKELYTELDGKKISVHHVLSKLAKMQQILGGFIYDNKGVAHSIRTNKYNLIGEILDQIGDDKIVIYARFKEELFNIKSYLKQIGYNSVLLHGSLSDTQRATNISAFRTDSNIKALVAQISTGGYGLTIVEANHVIYFSMTFSLIDYRQSQERIHRIGQTKTCVYHYLLTEDDMKIPVDTYIYKSLIKNYDFAKSLEDLDVLKKLRDIL